MSSDPKGLGATFDAHTDAEFKTRDIEATMATMADAPHLTHVPTMTGGNGRENVRRFYETWFIGHWPKDTSITPHLPHRGRSPRRRRDHRELHP